MTISESSCECNSTWSRLICTLDLGLTWAQHLLAALKLPALLRSGRGSDQGGGPHSRNSNVNVASSRLLHAVHRGPPAS